MKPFNPFRCPCVFPRHFWASPSHWLPTLWPIYWCVHKSNQSTKKVFGCLRTKSSRLILRLCCECVLMWMWVIAMFVYMSLFECQWWIAMFLGLFVSLMSWITMFLCLFTFLFDCQRWITMFLYLFVSLLSCQWWITMFAWTALRLLPSHSADGLDLFFSITQKCTLIKSNDFLVWSMSFASVTFFFFLQRRPSLSH